MNILRLPIPSCLPTLLAMTTLFAACAAPPDVEPQPASMPNVAANEAGQGLVLVTSPWGYSDLYVVAEGPNLLICSGTGRLFRFDWSGA